jgi:hypothetical protein
MTPTRESDSLAIGELMTRINDAWLGGRPEEMAPFLAEHMTMTLPGFSSSIQGREALIDGFREFGRSARLHECQISPPAVTVAGPVAVATFPFVVVYERDGAKWRSSGRDLWVFGRVGDQWLAAWRVMLDVAEEPAS